MAAPTSISVVLDLDEYSKFEYERRTMQIQWTASGGGDMSTEQLLVEVRKARRARDIVVYSTTITIGVTSDPATGTVSVQLHEDIVDSDLLNLVRRGYYYVRISSVTNTSVHGDSPDFPISVVTVDQLRNTYLFGLNLEAGDVRAVKMQPASITGVEVVEVSSSHPTGFSQLTYIYKGSPSVLRQISWGAGPIVSITSPGRYLLRYDCTGAEYIVIQVRNLSSLPTSSVTEDLFVTKAEITDDMIRRWIDQSCDWLENDKLAGVFLEPTRIVTDPINTDSTLIDYDFIVPPITFYPVVPAHWIDILFPYPGLLRLDELFGQVANTRIVDIALQWVEIAERSGLAQLVPYNQRTAFQFIGLVWVESMRGRIELPNFWHFNAMAGLRQVDPVLLEIIGKKAAVDALTVAGHAFRGGFASQSLSRDGVSESVSYTASAIYGIYSATIEDYTKFINREIKQLKGRYRGVNMVVL